MNHGAAKKYVTMSNDDIKQLPIKELADKNAVCFIWVTVPLLPEGLATLEAWGFKYKTMLTWRKVSGLLPQLQLTYRVFAFGGALKPPQLI
jgi:N6-adenosine-specific RNA methylase IME4